MVLRGLSGRVTQARGTMGIRAAATEIGISPTTLSKVERGHIPDIKTLNKITNWLGEEPMTAQPMEGVQVAFKKNSAISLKTAKSLAIAIQLAHKQFLSNESEIID